MTVHKTLDQLRDEWSAIEPSPAGSGLVEMIVIRPESDERETPDSVELGFKTGAKGDRWSNATAPEPNAQVTMINSRLLSIVAGSRDRWPLAGDNLVVDLDIGRDNLPAGSRLQIGSAVLEITPLPHTGCSKFSGRFGADALRFVNLGEGPAQRLRGVYAQVVVDGTVSVGDSVQRL